MAKEMLVTEGLNELKTLDARIERAIGDAKLQISNCTTKIAID